MECTGLRYWMAFELVMGKFANTFVHTDIMWDPDVNPEGFYEKYSFKGFKNIVPLSILGRCM